MNTAGLSLSDAPPFERIYPFFIASSIFGVFSFAALLFADSLDRYDPYIIGVVHLFTIGFLLNAAFGALSQMLPVVGGIKIESPKTIRLAQIGITLGALLFFVGFAIHRPLLFAAAAILSLSLLFAFGMLLKNIFSNTGHTSATVKGMRLSIILSLPVFLLGAHLLVSHASLGFGVSHIRLADIHMTLAVFGFFMSLVIAVSHQVLPMFYVSPEFPRFCRVWPAVIFTASLFLFVPNEPINIAAKLVIWLSGAAFAVVALKKLRERRRLLSDASLKLWQTGLISLIIALLLWAYDVFVGLAHREMLFALFFGLGFLGSVVKAMSNKIVPFLAWFHLANKGKWDAPSVREMITDKSANAEFYLHISSIFLFALSLFFAPLFAVASMCAMLSFLALARNIIKTVGIYKSELTKTL